MFMIICGILLVLGLFLLVKDDKQLKLIGFCLLVFGLIGLSAVLTGFLELPLFK